MAHCRLERSCHVLFARRAVIGLRSVDLLSEMAHCRLERDTATYIAAVSLQGGHWLRVVDLLAEMARCRLQDGRCGILPRETRACYTSTHIVNMSSGVSYYPNSFIYHYLFNELG